LPEVFAGFSRRLFTAPVRYPVACHPQAWAAGSVPFLLTTVLGLTPDAFAQRLRVVRPVLPLHVDELELRRLRLGAGSVDLRFRRRRDGVVDVEVLDHRGVDVQVEPHAELTAQ
jgi:glycogen debranching enzyme